MRRKDIKENPDLRFPEFSEPYIYKRFGGLLAKEARSFKMEDESEYRLVTVKRGYGGVVLRGSFKGKEVLVKSQFLLKTGDFLISKRQICHNACGIVPSSLEGAIVSNEYTVFLPKKDLDIVYFRYFCCLPIVSHTFFLSSIGVHIEKMLFKVDDWLKWEFPFPSLPEQQKIASFLAAVDKKIEQLTRKKELLEQYKNGVMQKIFSQEIRFKDENGEDYPDWEEKRLGEIGKFVSGTGFSATEQGGNKGIPFIKVSDMNLPDNDFYITSANNYVTKEQITRRKYKIIFGPSIIFAKVGAAVFLERKRIANCFLIDNNMMAFTPKNNVLFYKYVFENIRLSRYAQVGALPSYNAKDLSIIKYSFPIIEEQKQIADLLTSIDIKIASIQTQLTQTQNFKKGLLQKMFV